MSLYVDIRKDLGDFRLRVTFEAGQEVMGILGASGCGKSMTLCCIAGVEKPDWGRIVLDKTVWFDSERGINLPPQKRKAGLLFQNYALFPHMTVEQNLMTGLRAVERDRRKARAAAEEMMDRFCLTGLRRHRPPQLSGGQQQRAALARILLARPKVLMLDEPFSALDGYLRWKLEMELMDILGEFDGPTLFVSHSRDEIYRLCHRACVMDHGTSTPPSSVKAVFEKPQTLSACLISGCKNYSEAERDGGEGQGTRLYARDWGVSLDCGERVPKDAAYIGVRSHYIRLVRDGERKDLLNSVECRICRIVEDVFHMIVMVRPLSAPFDSDRGQLRLEMPKILWQEYAGQSQAKEGDTVWVRIAPEDILILKM